MGLDRYAQPTRAPQDDRGAYLACEGLPNSSFFVETLGPPKVQTFSLELYTTVIFIIPKLRVNSTIDFPPIMATFQELIYWRAKTKLGKQ